MEMDKDVFFRDYHKCCGDCCNYENIDGQNGRCDASDCVVNVSEDATDCDEFF